MMKKILIASILAIAPMFLQASAIEPDFNGRHHHKDDSCCEIPPPCSSSSSSCSTDDLEIAYFFIDASTVSGEESRVIEDEEAIIWSVDVFTIKSSGINVQPFVVPGSEGTDIIISRSGIYYINYSVYANVFEPILGSPDFYTMELQLNGSAIGGSRYTQTVFESLDVEDVSDANQLNGQVLTYISAGSHLRLVNESNHTIRLENEGGRNGVFASIYIQRIASTVE